MDIFEFVGIPIEFAEIKSFTPSKLYALFAFPNRSVVNEAPFTVPLFPLPLKSLALPLNGQYPTNPFCKLAGNVEVIADVVAVVLAVNVTAVPLQTVVALAVICGSLKSTVTAKRVVLSQPFMV